MSSLAPLSMPNVGTDHSNPSFKVYPNLETGCSEFYQCTNQKKVKSGECPQGLKFNLLTLRCDWANNVPIPCGTKITSSGMSYASGKSGGA